MAAGAQLSADVTIARATAPPPPLQSTFATERSVRVAEAASAFSAAERRRRPS
jgi:hypothetical protein